MLYLLTQPIETIPEDDYRDKMALATRLAPHREDAPYLAVALSLGIAIWSNDKGIHAQPKVRVYSTHELLKGLHRIG